ncbi:DUF1206 domain-containing protein [Phenylobacterium sp.]|jgi:hypothetical protein|uniref:DUF1206 domain-containing protein n=1 Tax=Phenylobacterium sp. TaxID=1871053 RepID=UPI000C900EBD|nr:DUF1206 domain-containing protein [Phenylobacterium sp.]MAK82658.1 hypothetical protein [Phenylobacterium sp.]|tara:strand:- start:4764 stop:5642 length:879 start_codon:yes stop_codon:yes gene_type:complete
MATASDHDAETALRQTLRWLGDAPLGALTQLACRFGYAARGFVYLSIGVIAVLAAVELVPEAEGSMGALRAWAEWPLGYVLLWITGLGLYGFAGWRLLQSVFDADRQGRELKAILSRIGQAISGFVYGGLGYSVFGALDTLEDLAEPDDRDAEQAAAQQALSMPGGVWLIVGVGVFIMAAGLANMVKAARGNLDKNLVCEDRLSQAAGLVGRIGYGARGLAFLVSGGMLARAGLSAQAEDAAGLGDALQALERAPFGSPLLVLVALGLVAFGLFALMEARYRRIAAGEVVED